MSNGWTHNKRPNIQTNWKTEEKYWELKHAHTEREREEEAYLQPRNCDEAPYQGADEKNEKKPTTTAWEHRMEIEKHNTT